MSAWTLSFDNDLGDFSQDMSDLQERVLTAKAVLIHGVYEGINYVVPCFPVLTVDIHRCRASVIKENDEPGPSFDCLVNSSEIHLTSWPQVIIQQL